MSTDSIGIGGDHSTLALWEAQLDCSSAPEIGMVLAQELAERISLNGQTPTETNYVLLTSDDGTFASDASPDGRSHDVSGAGNARLVWTTNLIGIYFRDDFCRVSRLELKGPGDNAIRAVSCTGIGASTLHAYHLVIHNDGANTANGSIGIYPNDGDSEWRIYRNVIYGYGGPGIFIADCAPNTEAVYNTLYANNQSADASRGGIHGSETDATYEHNASFDHDNADYYNTHLGTWDQNASSDATGDDDVDNLTTADQFLNPTETWGELDLRIKAGADLIDQGTAHSTTGFPEIDESIDNRGVSISGDWDLGACQYAGAPAFGGICHVVGGGLAV